MKNNILMSSFYLVKHGEGISNYVKELEWYLLKEEVLSSCVAPKFHKYSRQIYPIAAFKSLWQLSKIKDAYSIIHLHLPIPSLMFLFETTFKIKKMIFQIWNPPYTNEDCFDIWLSLFNSKKIFSLGIKTVDSPIIVSSKYLQHTIKDIGASNVHFIPAGIDVKRFSTSERLTKKNPSDEFSILYYGHLTRWKGVENLIKAMSFVKREYPSIKLKIVWTGHGKSYRQILQLIKKMELSDNVVIKNKLYKNVKSILIDADIGVLPLISSVATASPPRTLLEMMCAGLPVVATDVGGVSEIIKHKQTGILVKPSPKSIAEGLLSLLSSNLLMRKISVSAQDYVQKNHDWKKVGPLYIKFYEDFT